MIHLLQLNLSFLQYNQILIKSNIQICLKNIEHSLLQFYIQWVTHNRLDLIDVCTKFLFSVSLLLRLIATAILFLSFSNHLVSHEKASTDAVKLILSLGQSYFYSFRSSLQSHPLWVTLSCKHIYVSHIILDLYDNQKLQFSTYQKILKIESLKKL